MFTGFWKLTNDDSDSAVTQLLMSISQYLQAMSKVPAEPTLPDMISLLEMLDMCVKTDKAEETIEANSWTAMQEARERLRGLVTKDATDKLMEVFKKAHIEPAAAKEHLAIVFPKAPPQTMLDLSKMYNSVAAIVTSGVAVMLDVDKIEASTVSLAAHSRQYALASSFDLALVIRVAPEIASKMTSFVEAFSEALTTLVNKESKFAMEMMDKIDQYRQGSSRRCLV